ncbi:MAG: acyltransferase [Ferruginibacter sp.]
MTNKKSLDLVQMLRGIAILLVILRHTTNIVQEKFGYSFLGDFFIFGDSGVDIFFVLSGFIITYVNKKTLKDRAQFVTFLKRRFIRIYPTYWIIITALIALQLMLPSFYRTHFDLGWYNLISTYLLFPGHYMINGVSWTLTYEIFFYSLFSLAFLIRNKAIRLILSIGYIITLIALAIFGLSATSQHGWYNVVTFPMIVEFFMGIFAALIIPSIKKEFSVFFIVLGTVYLVAASLFTYNGYLLVDNFFNPVLLYGIPSFFIIIGFVRYELDHDIKVPRPLVWLGEASYSLYLIHLPVLVAAMILFNKLKLPSSFAVHAAAFAFIVIICAASILFFKWVEKPMIDKLNKLKV